MGIPMLLPKDHTEVEVERQLDLFEEEINGEGVGDKEPLVDPEDEDEVAGDISMSNALAVEDVVHEAEGSFFLDPLPSDQVNLSRVSIAKVSLKFIKDFMGITVVNIASYAHQQNHQ
jgi:hypothetical protein